MKTGTYQLCVCFIIQLLSVVLALGDAAAAWQVQTVDRSARVGLYASLALDASDGEAPHISYYDFSNGDLKHAYFNGTVWETETVDAGDDVGIDSVLAVGTNGTAHIVYYDFTNYSLKYARDDGGGWDTATIDSPGFYGEPSIGLDVLNRPHISYCDYDNQGLLYAFYNGSWDIQAVDEGSRVGYSAIAVDGKNKPHISYHDFDSRSLNYFFKGGGWHLEILDSAGYVGLYNAIAVDSTNSPHISYYDVSSGNLKYFRRQGAGSVSEVVDSSGYVGLYTSIAIDGDDNPHISYLDDSSGDLKYATHDGVQWHIQIVDSSGRVGLYTSLVLDSTDTPHIAYYDETAGALKYAVQTFGGSQSTTTTTAGSLEETTTTASGNPSTSSTTTTQGQQSPSLSITSSPVTAAVVGEVYYYAVRVDADDADLTFALRTQPEGMQISGSKGVVTWEPRISHVGSHPVRLQVSDSRGNSVFQDFEVQVRLFVGGGGEPTTTTTADSSALPIISSPGLSAPVGDLYYYVVVVNSEDSSLSYSLARHPPGMEINARKGLVTWRPSVDQVGKHDIEIQVSNDRGDSAHQRFSMQVTLFAGGYADVTSTTSTAAVPAPIAITSAPVTTAAAGRLYYYIVAAESDHASLSFSLPDHPEGMQIDEHKGIVTWTPGTDHLGRHNVHILAEDTLGNTAAQIFSLQVVLTQSCPAELVLGSRPSALRALRELRDRELSTSPAGRSLTCLYYAHAAELRSLLADDPVLLSRSLELLAAVLAKSAAAPPRRRPAETAAVRLRSARTLIVDLQAAASPGLRRALVQVLRLLDSGEILNLLEPDGKRP